MIKFRMYLDKDEEVKWLNQMSAEGWAMKSFFAGFFVFNKCEQGKYVYQIDFGQKPFKISNEYREFMKEAGIEIVQAWGWWIILRKLASEGRFELYSDLESSIEHYSKIQKMFKIAAIIEIFCLWMEVMAAVIGKVPYAIGCAFLIGAVVVALTRAAVRTTNIINRLKEQQTGMPVKKRQDVSMLMAVGLLLNGMALMIQDSVSIYLRHGIQIFAIAFMAAGLWDMCRKK